MDANDKLMLDLGIDVSRFNLLMNISQRLTPYQENESARDFLARLELGKPGITTEIFGSPEAAETVITDQIGELNEALRRIRVHKGLLQEYYPPSAFVVAVIARRTGTLIIPGETAAEWARRVERNKPGVIHFLAPTQVARKEVVEQSFSMFRREVTASKARLIISLLLGVMGIMGIILTQGLMAEATNPATARILASGYSLLLGINIWMAYLIRRPFYKAEDGAALI